MTRLTSAPFVAALLAIFLHAATAQAGLVRTCVSQAKGNDANASSQCHCTTPCRTFATAAVNTLADGEITVLDPGDYGGLTITRSISINNDSGGEASITVPGGNTGIIVNAVNGASYVNLRGLTIQGVGFGTTKGLTFNTGLFLTMTNCVVRNHTGNGIEFFPNASSNLAMSNTLVADNGGDGIRATPNGSGITVNAVFNRVETYNNSGHGMDLTGNTSTGSIKATVSESVSTNNVLSGFQVSSTAGGAAASMMVVRSTAANNGTAGIRVGTNATVRLSQSTVTGNATGLQPAGGTLLSYSDNNVDGNTTDGAPTGTLTNK